MHKNVWKINVELIVILEFEVEIEIQKYEIGQMISQAYESTKEIYLRPDGI